MSDSEQLSAGLDQDISDIKPAEAFVIPSQASKTIWDVNANNILQISSQIISLIKNNKISIQMVLHLIDVFSILRVKNIQYYAELYQKISTEFSYNKCPKNDELSKMLYCKGFIAGDFNPCFYQATEEEILNIYDTESPLYYIAWDKVDELKIKFPNLDINKKIDYEITPLDCAIKYGSDLCFNYLKNMGAMYTEKSSKYAVMGVNINIFSQMIEDGQSFDKLINKALRYKNYKIAQYLKSNFGQHPNSIAKSMYFGNYDIAYYLLSNGANINDVYDFFLFLFIIVILDSISFYIYHCLMRF
ncbi:hypothetical protein TVAG_104420 [Trichomonas vaginalis G3]|uniref:DUF3447 domain-containing protein n=1 Tax=Trichomonas vaginalis (strain ATCC PRA-98 / G3) TaxID=412133 RepID=A2F690_TRIV3|nr:spectrin binding [Trichomonas vaginalis G3]EAX99561.1 hypothetical protein TVAG_104420 [Trichomonas vaginalis G3]KAI5490946.1 spectrin binding [Trichomonas vaginalis G3]|eukprot:XP_001312491.1 hypothetical protein [Trichomonas vaginalis G3]